MYIILTDWIAYCLRWTTMQQFQTLQPILSSQHYKQSQSQQMKDGLTSSDSKAAPPPLPSKPHLPPKRGSSLSKNIGTGGDTQQGRPKDELVNALETLLENKGNTFTLDSQSNQQVISVRGDDVERKITLGQGFQLNDGNNSSSTSRRDRGDSELSDQLGELYEYGESVGNSSVATQSTLIQQSFNSSSILQPVQQLSISSEADSSALSKVVNRSPIKILGQEESEFQYQIINEMADDTLALADAIEGGQLTSGGDLDTSHIRQMAEQQAAALQIANQAQQQVTGSSKPSVSDISPDKRKKMIQVRQFIFREIYETERNYVANLSIVLKQFKAPLIRAALGLSSDKEVKASASGESLATMSSQHSDNTKGTHLSGDSSHRPMHLGASNSSAPVKPIIPMVDIKIIFAWIEELSEFSKTICEEMDKVVQQLDYSEQTWERVYQGDTVTDQELSLVKSVGKFFIEHYDGLKLYLKFVDNYSAAKEAIRRSDENSAAYRVFIAECLKNKDFQKQGIVDFLILPIQRVTRYVLLLQDYKKHMPADHPDFENVASALNLLRQLANTVNEVKRNEEEMTRMFLIVRLVENIPPTIISAQRRLTFECDCFDVTRDNILKAFSPQTVGNSGFSMVPSVATMMSTSGFDATQSSKDSNNKDKDSALLRLYIFNDVFAVAKAKGKKKWSSKIASTASDRDKDGWTLFRIGWNKDVDIVDLDQLNQGTGQQQQQQESKRFGFLSGNSNKQQKALLKVVIRQSDAGNPIARKKFLSELQEVNQEYLRNARIKSQQAGTSQLGTNALKRSKTVKQVIKGMPSVAENAQSAPTSPVKQTVDINVTAEDKQTKSANAADSFSLDLANIEKLALERLKSKGSPQKNESDRADAEVSGSMQSLSNVTLPTIEKGSLKRSTTITGHGHFNRPLPRQSSLVPAKTDIPTMMEQIKFETSMEAGLITQSPAVVHSVASTGLGVSLSDDARSAQEVSGQDQQRNQDSDATSQLPRRPPLPLPPLPPRRVSGRASVDSGTSSLQQTIVEDAAENGEDSVADNAEAISEEVDGGADNERIGNLPTKLKKRPSAGKNGTLSRSMSMGHRVLSQRPSIADSFTSTSTQAPSSSLASSSNANSPSMTNLNVSQTMVTETFVLEVVEPKQKNELLLLWERIQKKLKNMEEDAAAQDAEQEEQQ
ncbi:hypothetical protein MP228_003946 [Amoeboaphelidium protococcarum]|nr:hypothetical protein MP228_003946 [Amoeboaphelidium protococcarum]